MFDNEFALIFKAFCEGYKGFVLCRGMIAPEGAKYRILVKSFKKVINTRQAYFIKNVKLTKGIKKVTIYADQNITD